MRYLTPDNVSKALSHHRYWSRGVLELLYKRCDELRFRDPVSGHLFAEVLPDLVKLIPWSRLGCQEVEQSWWIRSVVLRVELSELAGKRVDLGPSTSFRGRPMRLAIAAEVLRRRGAVLFRRGDIDDAGAVIREAVDLYRRVDPGVPFRNPGLAEALMLDALCGGSTVNLVEAASLVEPRAPIHQAVAWGLVHRRDETTLEENQALGQWIQHVVRTHHYARSPCDPAKTALLWAQGLAHERVGFIPIAIRRFQMALKWLDPRWKPICAFDLYGAARIEQRDVATEALALARSLADATLMPYLENVEDLDVTELDERRRSMVQNHLHDIPDFYPVQNLSTDHDPRLTRPIVE